MADIKIKTIEPYTNVPYIPFGQVEQLTRHGAQYFSNVKQLQVGFGASVFRVDRDGMWAGAETFAAAPWKVDWDGNMTANSITLIGYIPTGGALTDIGSGNITNTYIGSNAIATSNIQSNAVTATKISVSSLSAISANIGSVTSGTITGALIRTSSSGSRVEISDSADSIKIYDSSALRMEMYDNIIAWNDTSAVQTAAIYASTSNNLLITGSKSASYILINGGASGGVSLGAGGNVYMTLSAGAVSMGTYFDFNNYWIEDIQYIDFRSRSSNPNSNGMLIYYDNGVTEGLRMQFGGSDFQFDASGV